MLSPRAHNIFTDGDLANGHDSWDPASHTSSALLVPHGRHAMHYSIAFPGQWKPGNVYAVYAALQSVIRAAWRASNARSGKLQPLFKSAVVVFACLIQ